MTYKKLTEYAYICCNAYKFELCKTNNSFFSKVYYTIGFIFFPISMHCEDIIIITLLVYLNYKEKHITQPKGTQITHTCYIKNYNLNTIILMDRHLKIIDSYPIIYN